MISDLVLNHLQTHIRDGGTCSHSASQINNET